MADERLEHGHACSMHYHARAKCDCYTQAVAWLHTYRKPGHLYTVADIGADGPDPEEGYEHYSKEPLCRCAPPPAAQPAVPEGLAEVLSMLLSDVMRCSAWYWFKNQESVKRAQTLLAAAPGGEGK